MHSNFGCLVKLYVDLGSIICNILLLLCVCGVCLSMGMSLSWCMCGGRRQLTESIPCTLLSQRLSASCQYLLQARFPISFQMILVFLPAVSVGMLVLQMYTTASSLCIQISGAKFRLSGCVTSFYVLHRPSSLLSYFYQCSAGKQLH